MIITFYYNPYSIYIYIFIIGRNKIPCLNTMDEETITYMLSDRIARSTLSSYKGKGMDKWKEFLVVDRKWSICMDNNIIVCLQQKSDTNDSRCKLFILYTFYLRQLGVADVSIFFKALAYDFITLGYHDLAELLKSNLVMYARNHGDRDAARTISQARKSFEKDAVSEVMLMNMYEFVWVKAMNSLISDEWDEAVAVLIGFCLVQFGLGISNLCKTESDSSQLNGRTTVPSNISVNNRAKNPIYLDQHVLRVEDVSVKVEGVSLRLSLLEFSKGLVPGSVTGIAMNFVSSKTNQKRFETGAYGSVRFFIW